MDGIFAAQTIRVWRPNESPGGGRVMGRRRTGGRDGARGRRTRLRRRGLSTAPTGRVRADRPGDPADLRRADGGARPRRTDRRPRRRAGSVRRRLPRAPSPLRDNPRARRLADRRRRRGRTSARAPPRDWRSPGHRLAANAWPSTTSCCESRKSWTTPPATPAPRPSLGSRPEGNRVSRLTVTVRSR